MNPVLYDIIDYNHEMEYHNGVVIIIQPGWYTFSANTRGAESNPLGECIGMRIVVENRDKSYGHR